MKFTDLKLESNSNTQSITMPSKKGDVDIKIKLYLPIEEKIKLLERVINLSVDEMHFYNSIKLDMFLETEILFAYTDLKFTDSEKENILSLYDKALPIINKVIEIIEVNGEYTWLHKHMMELVDSIYKYNNSILGIMNILTTDYSALGDELSEIQSKLGDPKNLSLLKDILTKLG